MAKRTLPLFYKIFFSVLMLAVCAVGVGLWMLNGVLEEYESVQPKNVADEIFAKYYASHDFDTLAAKCATENPFASAADVASYMHEKYDGAEMTCTSGAAPGRGSDLHRQGERLQDILIYSQGKRREIEARLGQI